MNFLASVILLVASLDPSASYDELYGEAYFSCKHRGTLTESQTRVLEDLVEVERIFFALHPEIPPSMRGMLLTAACRESRFTPRARGDWRIRNDRRVAMAHGVVQMWPWWKRAYNINRDDHRAAGKAWLTHVVVQYNKNKRYRRCPAWFSQEQYWRAAWVQVARGGRVNRSNRYRCFEVPSHYKTLQRWKRNIEAQRASVDADGC
jgi:hypothetical protein